MVGTSVTLVLVSTDKDGNETARSECAALVIREHEDVEAAPVRQGRTLVYASPDEHDVTKFGRSIRLLENIPHESGVFASEPYNDTHFWR